MKFGIANNVRSEVRECTPDLFNQTLDSPQVARTCAEIEDALERLQCGELTQDEYETLKAQLKKRLPIFTFHAMFANGKRKNDDAIPSGFSIYDLDHIPNPHAKWVEIEARKEELAIVLAHISPSLQGLRLVFVVPQGMTLEQAQAWMARQLGDEKYDACVKDYARCSFAVPREYVLFVDEEGLFSDRTQRHRDTEFSSSSSDESFHSIVIQSEGGDEAKNLENVQVDAHEILPPFGRLDDKKEDAPQNDKSGEMDDKEENKEKLSETPCNSVVNKNSVVKEEEKENSVEFRVLRGENQYPETYEDIPYADLVQTLEEQMGGQPEHGSRNNFIFSMACHLRYVCNDDAQWIARILPTYGEAREKWMASIRSACARSQTKTMPRIMRRTLKICKQRKEEESDIIHQTSDVNLPPEMPRKLPPLIKLLVSRTPKIYQPAVAHAVFPALGAHLWKTTFRYIDNTLHEATLANVLMAHTGAGKSCICQPVDYILADIRERDKKNMEREKKWKQEMQTKGANKDKKMRPEGIVIQEIDPDVTPAAFVQRMADAEERFLYVRMNEIELFNNLAQKTNSKGPFQLMCLAFDYRNDYGQTRASTVSVSERVCVRLNYNISTTIRKGQAYFRQVLTDGPLSRINFSTIPERPIGSEMPVYGTYGADFEEELRPYIERLNEARGLVECKQATRLAKQLMLENADFARLSQNRVYENFSFRANVIAFLKAMVLYVAHGQRWDKTMEEFVRWSLRYDLWCKMHFFGAAIEEIENADLPIKSRRGPQNLLDLLPEVFTREEAGIMRNNQGIRQGTLKSMLSNWKKRGYIEIYGEEMPIKDIARQRYAKTETYLKKFAPR